MKKFEDLYTEIEASDEIKLAWKEAVQENKRNKKIAISIFVVMFLIISIIVLTAIIKLEGFNFLAILKMLMSVVPFMFFIGMIIFVISMVFTKKHRKYNNIFKETIIKKLIENFYNNVEYFPNKQMPSRIYNEEKYEHYDRYYSDDYIEAKINNKYDIEMAEVKTVEESTRRDSDGRTHTTRTTKFHGIFAKVIIDKCINSELKIKRNGNATFTKSRLEMDSSEFEKYFDVSTTNKIIGMQLLTADVMEELIDFVNKTNMRYDIVIKNDTIYLRFHSGTMFETGNLKKGAIDKEIVQKYFYMLNFTYNLSNKIIKLIHETEI